MTRSEIPQLEVITAIADADSEDFLAQLLFSQGWSIIHRAFDSDSLIRFMAERGLELRTVIVYQSSFPGLTPELLATFSSPTITFISLDSFEFTSHEIMTAIRSKLREPMVQQDLVRQDLDRQNLAQQDLVTPSPKFPSSTATSNGTNFPSSTIKRINRNSAHSSRNRKVIAVTGSTGAPGKTRFATALAEELSTHGVILLIDADIRSHGISKQREIKGKNRVEVLPLDRESRPTYIPEGDEVAVVDLGTLPGLAEAVTDRRWHGSLVNNVLDRATHLIYICNSTPTSIAELNSFLREYPLLLKKLPVSYICVLAGHSRELREWENKFLTLTMGENRFVLREGQLDSIKESGLLGFFRLGNSKRKEIATIATSLV